MILIERKCLLKFTFLSVEVLCCCSLSLCLWVECKPTGPVGWYYNFLRVFGTSTYYRIKGIGTQWDSISSQSK